MNMKNVLIYFRKDALLEQGNMPSQSRETSVSYTHLTLPTNSRV